MTEKTQDNTTISASKFKFSTLRDDLMIALSNIEEVAPNHPLTIKGGGCYTSLLALGNEILSPLAKPRIISDGHFTGPIDWIEHFSVSASRVKIGDISGGWVKILFNERVRFSAWDGGFTPDQAVIPNHRDCDIPREVDSIFKGDHRMAIECENPYVQYHLTFESVQ